MKRCSKCKQTKEFVEFSKNVVKKDGYQGTCKSCKSLYVNDDHRKNVKIRKKKHKKVIRQTIKEYLLNHPCVDCGNDDIRVLEFDHVSGTKTSDISNIAMRGWCVSRLISEIDKCQVRCANCHRIVTYERRLTKQTDSYNENVTPS